ncbi:MAG TPA: sigma-70 family RNA polymerase sigma factor [Fimbriiglobus sp.]|nr:sigma-70 family RNA polymerase sigma factor [Fimbriiglobus sp.]
MPAEPRGGVAQRLCRTLLRAATDRTDGQLLDRFLAGREEAAFAALVRRPGPMVFGVCRRVLGNAADADDAFQATFVVLVRKAGSLAGRGTVGDFLYGVAYHTALKARAQAVKRRAKEARAAVPDRPDVDTAERDELLKLLDRELARLPGKYREPVVLCDLEGRPRAEVAGLLGIPEGTLSSRLTTARRTLADRLGRHGLAVSAGAVAAALGRSTDAAVPGSLVGAAVRAAGGAVPAAVAHLAAEVAKMMLLGKLKAGAAGFAAVTLLGAAIGLAAVPGDGPTAKPVPPAKAAAKPAAKAAEPAWMKDFREAYGLKDGETLKLIPPPFPDCRRAYYDAQNPDPKRVPAERMLMVLRWDGGKVQVRALASRSWSDLRPGGDETGWPLRKTLEHALDVAPAAVEGDANLLATRVDADVAVRGGASAERRLADLERELKAKPGIAVRFALRDEEREVVVARGKYTLKPAAGDRAPVVNVYARTILPEPAATHFSGADKFLVHLGEFLGRQVIDETDRPSRDVAFKYQMHLRLPATPQTRAQDTDPDAVLKNVAAQTGLTFKIEKRKVRVLFVRKAEDKRKEAEKHYEEGHKHVNARRFDDALAEFTRAIELDPTFEQAYYARQSYTVGRHAPAERTKQDFEAAIGDLSTILVLNPNHFAARYTRAGYYSDLRVGEVDKAIADYSQIIAGPTDFSRIGGGKDDALALTHYNRGRVYQTDKKDYDKAITDYTEALRLKAPAESKMAMSRNIGTAVHLQRAQCYRAKKQYDKADADYAAGAKAKPERHTEWALRGVLHEWAWQLATCPDPKYRDGKKAVELAERLRERTEGRWSYVLVTLAAAYAEAGDFAKAVEWQTKAIGLLEAESKQREAMQARLKRYEAGKPYHEE